MFIYKGCSNPLKIVNISNQWHSGIHSLTYHQKHKSLRALHHDNPSVTTNSLFSEEGNSTWISNWMVIYLRIFWFHKHTNYWNLLFKFQMHSLVPNTENIFTQPVLKQRLCYRCLSFTWCIFTHTRTYACAHTHTQQTDLKLTWILELCNIAEQFVCWPLVSIYISNIFSSLLLFLSEHFSNIPIW